MSRPFFVTTTKNQNMKKSKTETQKPKFVTCYSYKLTAKGMEHPEGDSLTVPNDAYSIRDLMERFVKGIPPQIAKLPRFADMADFDNIDPTFDPAFDIVDAYNELNQIEARRASRKTPGAGSKPEHAMTEGSGEQTPETKSEKSSDPEP